MDTLRVTEPVRLHDVVVIPVQRVRVEPTRGPFGVSVVAHAAPYALVVRERGRWRALDAEGAELALAGVLERVPELEATLREEDERAG